MTDLRKPANLQSSLLAGDCPLLCDHTTSLYSTPSKNLLNLASSLPNLVFPSSLSAVRTSKAWKQAGFMTPTANLSLRVAAPRTCSKPVLRSSSRQRTQARGRIRFNTRLASTWASHCGRQQRFVKLTNWMPHFQFSYPRQRRIVSIFGMYLETVSTS